MTRNAIRKELLEELYLDKRLTLKQIAQKLGKGYSTIHYWMKKHGIPRRPSPSKTFPIPKETLLDLYWKKKLNTKQIAKLYQCDDETIRKKLIKFGIQRRSNSESKTKYPKTSFSGDLVEKAYILGLRTGDFYVKRNHALVRISTTTTHRLMLDLIKNAFGKYGNVMEKEGSKVRGNYIDVDLDNSFEFPLEKPKKIPQWILGDDKLFYAFLAGYVDADGCWTLTYDGRKGTRMSCTIKTQDKMILRQITGT